MILILSMMASITLSPNALAQVYFPVGTKIPTYAFINVAPNPIGVGQAATVNFFLATPMETGERPTNMSVIVTYPDGTSKSLGNGNFTGDQTGGTFTTFTPDQVGNYTFQFFYGGQTLIGGGQWNGLVNQASQSSKATLVVQQDPIVRSTYPFTPLPTNYWEIPVTAENVQNWYTITGPWLGLAANSFAATGSYNVSSYCNPYTQSVTSGHILWTKPWAAGGVAGGDAGGTESSNYWSTSQYEPKYAPVVIDGIMYSTWYTTTTSYSNGIVATNLYTGQTLWTINTTNALRCGNQMLFNTINQYGVVGPYIWTTGTLPAADTGGTTIANTGTQWNMYDGFTGKYILSVVNGSALTLRTDDNGNLIGYFINSTAGTEIVHPFVGVNQVVTNTGPHLSCVNLTMAMGQTGTQLTTTVNTVRPMSNGIMWSRPLPTNVSGVTISPALSINSITGDAVVMSTGYIHGQGVGGESAGWLVVASMDQNTGDLVMSKNITYSDTAALLPYTRTTAVFGYGMIVIANDVSYEVVAFDVRTGTKVWDSTLQGKNNAAPNTYDLFSLKPYFGNGILYWEGLGGDLWAQNVKDGKLVWYTNTTELIGDPGIETPYDIWPLWVFSSSCLSNDVAYFAIGHEYNPPLFHGAQLLAINATNGKLIWSELDTSVTSSEISYGILLSLNAYDNQVYAFGKGPSATTVSAPNIGATTATPITITGTVTDVSAGTKQSAVAANFPNGLPCVSDASMSHWMEYVYQQQQKPTNVTGVPVTLSVLDSNGNFRSIGTTTTNAMGTYGLTWTPDISGYYNVIATFEGTEGYYPSSAATYFYASEPAPTASPGPQIAQPPTEMYFTISTLAIIIAIAIVGAILALLLLRKRP
jgi:hypothetical protein